jgi:hypothetical protein
VSDIDGSTHEHVRTHGGDFYEHHDNDPVVASGDHSVGTRQGIYQSTVTPGDKNVVGDNDHSVTGNGNETAFGSGDASRTSLSHADFGKGSAFTVNGTAEGHNTHNSTDTSTHSSGSGPTSVSAAGPHAQSHQYADQHEADHSQHSHYDDESRIDRHEISHSHNAHHLHDSHDYTAHH